MLEHELKIAKHAVNEVSEAILCIADVHYKRSLTQADRTVVTKG